MGHSSIYKILHCRNSLDYAKSEVIEKFWNKFKFLGKTALTEDKDSQPRGNCNPRFENGGLQTGRLQTRHFETPRFQCSELQRLD